MSETMARNGQAAFKGSLVALVTPFVDSAEQAVDYERIHGLVDFHAKSGTSGIVPCGTTAESPTLSHDEHDRVIRETIDAAKGTSLVVVAGTGSNSTRECYRLTSQAAESGADACLVVCPYYNKPTPDGIVAHYREIDRIGLPIIVYNIPGRTGINIDPRTLERIANECSNVIGLKASNGDLDQITETAKRMLGRRFSILSGDDSLTLPILSVGGVGVVSVAGNIMPRVMASLVECYRDRQTGEALALAQTIHEFCRSLLRVGSNPAPVKALMNRAGLEVGGCRLPLVAIDEAAVQGLIETTREMLADADRLGITVDDTLRRVVS